MVGKTLCQVFAEEALAHDAGYQRSATFGLIGRGARRPTKRNDMKKNETKTWVVMIGGVSHPKTIQAETQDQAERAVKESVYGPGLFRGWRVQEIK